MKVTFCVSTCKVYLVRVDFPCQLIGSVCCVLRPVWVARLISQVEDVASYVVLCGEIRHYPRFIGSSHLQATYRTVSALPTPAEGEEICVIIIISVCWYLWWLKLFYPTSRYINVKPSLLTRYINSHPVYHYLCTFSSVPYTVNLCTFLHKLYSFFNFILKQIYCTYFMFYMIFFHIFIVGFLSYLSFLTAAVLFYLLSTFY